jgi:hypothetical protein
MLFGYLVVRNLRVLVWIFGRLPDGFSRAFATPQNTGTLLGEDLAARHAQLLALAGRLSPKLGQHLERISPPASSQGRST